MSVGNREVIHAHSCLRGIYLILRGLFPERSYASLEAFAFIFRMDSLVLLNAIFSA